MRFRLSSHRSWLPVVLATSLAIPTVLAGSPAPALAEAITVPNVQIDLTVNDLVADPAGRVIYASVPSRAGVRGNSVTVIDAETGELGASVFVGSEPNRLAMSDDGAFLYVALDGAGAVRQLALPNLTLVRQFTVGNSQLGVMTVDDMAVMPGNPQVVAIARQTLGFSPRHQGVAIYDRGAMRPTTTPTHTGSNEIEFSATDPTRLHGYNNETTDFGFRRMSVTSTGVSVVDVTPGLLSGFAIEMIPAGDRVYSSNGRVVEAESRTLAGTLPVGSGRVLAVDGMQHRAFAVSEPSGQPGALQVFDTDTFLQVDSFELPTFSGPATRMILTGIGDLALATAGGDVFLLAPQLLRGSAGEYTPLTPDRVLDTRNGTGRGGQVAPLGPGGSMDVQITGRGGVPASGVDAVVLNATVTGTSAPSHLTIWPTGYDRPEISNLNYLWGQTVANLVTVAVGDGGRVSVFNASGVAHVIFDVAGYYSTADGPDGHRFHPVAPTRAFDTRNGAGGVLGPIQAESSFSFDVAGKARVPASGATAVVMNVTVVNASRGGYLTVHPGDVAEPVVSNINFDAGRNTPNLVIVRLPSNGKVRFALHGGAANVLADVVGYFDDNEATEAGRLFSFEPFRVVDTRSGMGVLRNDSYVFGSTSEALSAYVLNVTVAAMGLGGYLTAYPYPGSVPNASTLNFAAWQVVPNLAIVPTGPQIAFYASEQTHLIVDMFGAYT